MVQETYTGRGLFPGEAYAPNVPSLIEAAAMAPAPEGAYLLKLANQFAPGGAPTVQPPSHRGTYCSALQC